MLQWLLSHTPLLYFTQSLWRDEAFSVLTAERPISFILEKLSFEPPVYYLLLHFWMKLFGVGEIAVRSLSLLGFALATIVVIHWGEKLFKRHWLSRYLAIFFFLNPMLLYYAFEVRAYGWYILFAVLSMYTYTMKQWRWYIVTTVLGFYTHTYFIFVPFVQFLHWAATSNIKKYIVKTHGKYFSFKSWKTLFKLPEIRSFVIIFLLILPWLVKVVAESSKLKSSWYYPVDFHLIKSVLGNMFIGYEGTPWFLWKITAYVSLILLVLFVVAMRSKINRNRNFYFLLAIIAPLVVTIGISFMKPLFVNRYLIPVTIGEIFLVVFAIESIRHPIIQKIVAGIALLFVIVVNMWYPSQHPKLDIRNTVMQVNALVDSDDVWLAQSPLIFFETIYYSTDRSRVYLYNPADSAFPWYVGDAIVSPEQMVHDLPPYPVRGFLIRDDGTFTVAYRTSDSLAHPTNP